MEENKKFVFNIGNQTGEVIRAARKKAGLTQKMLADKLGVSLQLVSQWETGRRYPRNKTLGRIAEALDVSIVDLIGINRDMLSKNIENAAANIFFQHQKRISSVAETIEELFALKYFLNDSGENYFDTVRLKEIATFIDTQIKDTMLLYTDITGYEYRIMDYGKSVLLDFEDIEEIEQHIFIIKTTLMKYAVSGEAIIDDFIKLNDEGRAEAAKRVNELTFIPKYNRKSEQEE